MNSISVLIYSYKGKLIKDVVRLINQNSSGDNEINIIIADQSPLSKSEYFNTINNVDYNHIFWDYPYGSGKYIKYLINKSKSEYTLLISDTTFLNKDWDKNLLQSIGQQNIVISGIGKPKITHKNLFYIDAHYEESDSFYLSNFIDKYFIFAKTDVINLVKYPEFLKHLGQNEYLSIKFFYLGVDILSAPSYIAQIVKENSLDCLYVPFSIKHNYNMVIEMLKNQTKFLDFHGLSSDNLFKIPYPTNDVDYDCYNNEFDKLDGRRFFGKINYIR